MTSEAILFVLLAGFSGATLLFGLQAGVMPMYLTGPATRKKSPAAFWVATAVFGIVFAGSVIAAIYSA